MGPMSRSERLSLGGDAPLVNVLRTHLKNLSKGRDKSLLRARRELISSLMDTNLFSARDFSKLLNVSDKSYRIVSNLRKEGKGFELGGRGRPDLSLKDQKIIREMFYDNSHPSFNKKALNDKNKLVPKRILNAPVRHIINCCGLPYNRKTIRKYMPRKRGKNA